MAHLPTISLFVSKVILTLACTALLCGVLVESTIVNASLQLEAYHFYQLSIPIFIFLSLLGGLILKANNAQPFHLRAIDWLPLLFGVTLLFTYQWTLNPAPERLTFLLQATLLWYSLRIVLGLYPVLSRLLPVVLVLLGGVQAIIGIRQLYGYEVSNHSLFNLTGTFYNPGPYSGYLSVIFPISLYFILHFRHYRRLGHCGYMVLHYLGYASVFLLLVVLPAGMSRTAWVAAALSGLFVAGVELKWSRRLHGMWKKYRQRMVWLGCGVLFICLVCSLVLFSLKKDSANGRLFLWKMDVKAWTMNKWGVGLGGFPAAYAMGQADYFSRGDYTETEELVAGTPTSAFNEYLQLLVEHSVWGLALALGFSGYVVGTGVRNRQIPWVGALVALLVFAFASYPMQLPVFVVTALFASACCLTPNNGKAHEGQPAQRKGVLSDRRLILISLLLLFPSLYLSYTQRELMNVYTQWRNSRLLYNIKVYDKAADEYAMLHDALKHNPDFLFEYGQCLAKSERYEASNLLMEQGTKLSGDPMFWNVMGRNHQALGAYEQAEICFMQAVCILPGRLYPYYLLTKLYAEPQYRNTAKMRQTAEVLLTKEAKVQSPAVREMRDEIKKIVDFNE